MMLDRALALYELGFRVIPLGTYADTPPKYLVDKAEGDIEQAKIWWTKTPRIRWAQYQNEPVTEALIEKWWHQWPDANIALLTGIEVFVVDADSVEAIDWIEQQHITVTPWRVRTGKGMHYYYAMTPGMELKNSVNIAARIDTRGRGGYVVAPGSIHYSGAEYAWNILPGWDCVSTNDLPTLTAEDLVALQSYNGLPAALPLPDGAIADLRTVSAAGGHDGSPVGEGARNMAAASLAGQAIRQGQSITETVDILNQWNAANQPPLPSTEIQIVAASVANTHLRNTGQAPLLAPIPPLPGIAPPPPPPLIDPLTNQPIIAHSVYEATLKRLSGQVHRVSELVARAAPVVENFWGEDIFFRRARLMIVGQPKIGKSRFALNMAMAASMGGQFLGRTFTRPYRVVWMQAEIRYAFLRRRIDAVRDNLTPKQAELVGSNLVASERLSIDLTDDVDYAVMQTILDEHKPDILVIDPIIEFSTISENDAKEVSGLLKRINQLEEKYNCAMILVHHTTKLGQQNGKRNREVTFENVRGSSVFTGWFDTGVLLTGTQQKTQVQWSAREATIASTEIGWNHERGEYQTAFDDVVPIERVVHASRQESRVNSLLYHAQQILTAAGPGNFIARADLSAQLEALDPAVATGGTLRDCFAQLSASSEYEFSTENGVQMWAILA